MERWSRAAVADPALAQSLRAAQAEQRALRPELDAGIGGSTRTAVSSVSTRTRRSRSRGRATSSATASSPSFPHRGPTLAVLPDVEVELARQQWQDGNRRVEAARRDHPRYLQLTGQVDTVVAALRRRIGQIFTLAELADAYDGADVWTGDAARRRRPRAMRRRSSRARSPTPRSMSTLAARRTTAREARPARSRSPSWSSSSSGVAVGEALHDSPKPGGSQTLVRTLHPLPLAPAALETVTVTVSNH